MKYLLIQLISTAFLDARSDGFTMQLFGICGTYALLKTPWLIHLQSGLHSI